jgi:glycine reductase
MRVVHYVNQFFGGIGGEEKANIPVEVREGPVGPGRLLQQLLGDQGSVVATIICGDNHINEEPEALKAVVQALREARPDVVIAGPAFDAGRYGLACGAVCQAAEEIGIPAVTAMEPENPGVISYRRSVVMVPTDAGPAEMQSILSQMQRIALKLGAGEELGPAEEEGYLPRGIRKLATRQGPGYKRALAMLVKKLNGQPFVSEVPFQSPENVSPAAALPDLSRATIALVSTGGLIPKGNPDRMVAGNADRYHAYSIEGLASLTSDRWEAFHSGYYNQIASDNPNYILPLSHLRHLESEGIIGQVCSHLFTMAGVSTPVANSKGLGVKLAQELKEKSVDACILVAT